MNDHDGLPPNEDDRGYLDEPDRTTAVVFALGLLLILGTAVAIFVRWLSR